MHSIPLWIQLFCTDPTDYMLPSEISVVFTGSTVACLTFELTEDAILEGSEMFTVEITDFGGALMGSITSATVTIEDNDGEYLIVNLVKGTIQRAPCIRVISVYFCLNVCKLYNGPIRLLVHHDFTVRCIQVESIARGHWMVPLS